MTTYNFPNHIKGDTFKARQIIFNFDITGAEIKMQFKKKGSLAVAFEWSTLDNTFTVNDALTGSITMNSRILNFKPEAYVYEMQVTDQNDNVKTWFEGQLLIIQDITQ
jgi:hypothetical protein